MTPTRPSARAALSAAYRAVWSAVAVVVYAVGVLAVLRSVPWPSSVAVLLTASLLAGSCALSAQVVVSNRMLPGPAARVAAAAGVLVLTALGLGAVLGAPGVALLLLVHLGSPATPGRVRALVHRSRQLAVPPSEEGASAAAASWGPARVVDRTPLEIPEHMSDADLCLAWESSTVALRGCRSVQARAGIVRARQACLDELERRQPDAMREWLASGDLDASPARFLIP